MERVWISVHRERYRNLSTGETPWRNNDIMTGTVFDLPQLEAKGGTGFFLPCRKQVVKGVMKMSFQGREYAIFAFEPAFRVWVVG